MAPENPQQSSEHDVNESIGERAEREGIVDQQAAVLDDMEESAPG
jgi:hypothetical protein